VEVGLAKMMVVGHFCKTEHLDARFCKNGVGDGQPCQNVGAGDGQLAKNDGSMTVLQ